MYLHTDLSTKMLDNDDLKVTINCQHERNRIVCTIVQVSISCEKEKNRGRLFIIIQILLLLLFIIIVVVTFF